MFLQKPFFNQALYMLIPKVIFNQVLYSQTCVQRPPLGLKTVQWLRQRWSLFKVYSYKIDISLGKFRLKLAIVDRWSLFRGGC
jgi:hypothetical protein